MRIGLDLAPQLEHLQLFAEQSDDAAQLLLHIVNLQHLLRVADLDAHIGGDGIDELQRVFHVQRGVDQLARHAGHELGHAREKIDDGARMRFQLHVLFAVFGVQEDARLEVRLSFGKFFEADAV